MPLCFIPGHELCSVRVLMDTCGRCVCARLRSCGGRSDQLRDISLRGETIFAFLSPGNYALDISRGGDRVTLLLILPPGGNISIRWGEDGKLTWDRDMLVYFWNRADNCCMRFE